MILRLDSTDDLHLAFTSHLNTPLFVRSFSTINFKQILRSPFISHYQLIESVVTGKNLKKREKWSNNIQYNVQWLVKVFEYLLCKTFTNRSCVLCNAYVYIVYVYIFFYNICIYTRMYLPPRKSNSDIFAYFWWDIYTNYYEQTAFVEIFVIIEFCRDVSSRFFNFWVII